MYDRNRFTNLVFLLAVKSKKNNNWETYRAILHGGKNYFYLVAVFPEDREVVDPDRAACDRLE